MSYIILFLVTAVGYGLDVILQAVHYFGESPWGGVYLENPGYLFVLALFYSLGFFMIFSVPGILGLTIYRFTKRGTDAVNRIPRWCYVLHLVLISLLIALNHADHEVLRFMGLRYSVEMLKAYNIFSDTTSFVWGILKTDARGAYSALYFLLVPVLFLILGLVLPIRKIAERVSGKMEMKRAAKLHLGAGIVVYLAVFGLIISLVSVFIKNDPITGFGWKPSFRQIRVSPIFISFIEDIRKINKFGERKQWDYTNIAADVDVFRSIWLSEERDPNWKFGDAKYPLFKTYEGNCPARLSKELPNIVMMFLETNRAMSIPDFNSEVSPEHMPFIHSLISGESEIVKQHHLKVAWFSNHTTSGLPTIDSLMAAHLGIPAHSNFTVSSTFTARYYPSFASRLTNIGYYSLFIDGADGSFTNWSMWIRRWYKEFKDIKTSDDKYVFNEMANRIIERRDHKDPYLVTATTMTNHVPFDVPEGGVKAPDGIPLRDRIFYTLRYEDDQIRDFFETLSKHNAISNTLFIIVGDHGYALGDVPKKDFIGDNYDSLRFSVTWVPLIMVYSGDDFTGLPEGKQTQISSTTDVAPTILEIAGICDENSFTGHSLIQAKKHHNLVNKMNNFMYRDDNYTSIFVSERRAQLFRTDDLFQKTDLSETENEIVEKMKTDGESVRRVIDYAYEADAIPQMKSR